jgi:hypothetical protein
MQAFPKSKWLGLAAVTLLAFAVPLGLAPARAEARAPAQPVAQKQFQQTRFTQIKRDDAGKPLAMQKAIVRYVPAQANPGQEGLSVDLVGVVHIADQKFYEQLNVLFKDYDVVLWEGVKGKPNNELLAVALGLLVNHDKSAAELGLASQGKVIDYKAPNFVHADVTWDEWGERIEKSSGWLSLAPLLAADILQLTKAQKQQESVPAPKDLLQKKIQMAEHFEQSQFDKSLGQTLHKLVIELRNDACMEVFQKQVAAGKKRIAIFYGSGHMPDFERRLLQEFGMQRHSVVWLDAWDLTAPKSSPTAG